MLVSYSSIHNIENIIYRLKVQNVNHFIELTFILFIFKVILYLLLLFIKFLFKVLAYIYLSHLINCPYVFISRVKLYEIWIFKYFICYTLIRLLTLVYRLLAFNIVKVYIFNWIHYQNIFFLQKYQLIIKFFKVKITMWFTYQREKSFWIWVIFN